MFVADVAGRLPALGIRCAVLRSASFAGLAGGGGGGAAAAAGHCYCRCCSEYC